MNTSPTLAKLLSALVKAQAEFNPVLKEKTNPAFRSKYADLSGAIDATSEALRKHGLAIVQAPESDSHSALTLTTTLFHESGEFMQSSMLMPLLDKVTPQSIGSAITYARRYSYMAMLSIAPEDDDCNSASGNGAQQEHRPAAHIERKIEQQARAIPQREEPTLTHQLQASIEQQRAKAARDAGGDVPSVRPAAGPRISEAQAKRFHAICSQNNKSSIEVKAAFSAIGIERSTEIPRDQYDTFCEWAASGVETPA